MAKSKCYLCNKRLRGGEGTLRQFPDGQVHKVCFDTRGCKMRQPQHAMEVPKLDKAQEYEADEDPKEDFVLCENYIKDVTIFTAAACVGMALAALLMFYIFFA